MYARIFVAGESDVTKLARVAGFNQRSVRAVLVKNAVRIVEADDLVVLDQIDVVDVQTLE